MGVKFVVSFKFSRCSELGNNLFYERNNVKDCKMVGLAFSLRVPNELLGNSRFHLTLRN